MGTPIHDWHTFDPIIIAETLAGAGPGKIASLIGINKTAVQNRRAHLRAMKRLAIPKQPEPPVPKARDPREIARANFGGDPLPAFHPLALEVLGWKPGAAA